MVIAAAVVFVVVTVVVALKLHSGDYKDAEVWYQVGRRVLLGQAVIGLRSFRYPPAFAVMIAPLCALPFAAFFLVWYLLNAGLFVLSVRLAAKLVSPAAAWRDLPRYWAPTGLVCLFAIDNLFLGQTNILVMALVYWAFLEVARNREWRAGLPLAAAVAVKVFPLPLLAYFAYRWRVRAVISSLLWCLLLLVVLPAPVRGFRRNLNELAAWGERVVMPYVSQGKAGDWGQHALDFGNQSLQAVLNRYLSRVNVYVVARDPRRAMYVNVADLSQQQINWVIVAAFAVLAVSFAAACGWRRPRDTLQAATEYSLAIMLVLLVSALSWTYFFVMLLLPVMTAMALLGSRHRLGPAPVWGLRVSLWALGAAIVLEVSAYARALGNMCWTTLILYAALALACRDLRRRPARKYSFQAARDGEG